MIRLHCSKCATKLTVGPEFAGKSVSCPECGSSLAVPAATGGSQIASIAGGERKASKETNPASPNIWDALGIGTGIFFLLYLVALPFKQSFYYAVLAQRGWASFAETLLFGCGVAFLILKFMNLRQQRSAITFDVLPVSLGHEISKANLPAFITHIHSLPIQLRDSFMVRRVRKALEFFELHQANPEVAEMIRIRSGMDRARIDGSYTLVKVCILAIPILGFIGTATALSQAIADFKGVMSGAKEAQAMMSSMEGVTTGLATAFDITLLALFYSIILSLLVSSIRKAEEENLDHIDAYCNEILLPRLNDGSNAAGSEGSAPRRSAR